MQWSCVVALVWSVFVSKFQMLLTFLVEIPSLHVDNGRIGVCHHTWNVNDCIVHFNGLFGT